MELRHLRYFVTVAEELHFGRAAARLNMAQPPLSQQIRKLEEELGFSLFSRSKQHVELTDAGKVFLEESRSALARVEQAREAAEKASRGQTGRLAIGFVGSATYHIVPLLQQYRLRFPSVELKLHQMKSGSQLQALHEKSIHLGIVRASIHSPHLNTELFMREPFMAVLPEAHPLAGRQALSVRDLEHEPFILSPRQNGSTYHDAVIHLCYKAGFSPNIALEAPEILTVVAFVAEGMGVALVPASFRHQQNQGVVYRDIREAPVLETAFIWRKDEKAPVLHEFLKLGRTYGGGTKSPIHPA
ncbi:LysR family transcriptional regulator [Paenibacillus tyrfis]|uniref:LysR substrate-binding domain-containing protein n=1 Tax=Paenibacillus tyrfis TaxID=1501230 RepID=UPI00248F5727|nr:LysR substrate-binding domain-containing protein [Paenibacillus tyrfis]GLI05112.1 LysR family transcriptional regulator [Paenibacillus tyrfis]